MEIQESHHSWHELWSETDNNPKSNRVGYSGPLSAFEAALQFSLAGKRVEGPISLAGNRLVCKANGMVVYAVTLVTYLSLWWVVLSGSFPLGCFFSHPHRISSSAIGLYFYCVYFQGRRLGVGVFVFGAGVVGLEVGFVGGGDSCIEAASAKGAVLVAFLFQVGCPFLFCCYLDVVPVVFIGVLCCGYCCSLGCVASLACLGSCAEYRKMVEKM
ncbi:hypothetical protein Pint_09965 [Pistacia integerrima]|uniref:Uncharacterized protein n=1 Tax=Pistacia integerrima TaxID=434235 RepID=A0ACC0XML2_9ROSI|nr:hypothetical protein Pint_09965 [Pistacia integerrima]